MTNAAKPTPCSDQSLARNDPMFGTAGAGKRWLMLELAGPWGHSAFLQSPCVIDPQLGRTIVRRAEAAGIRIAAIRRPGRRTPEPRWRWFIAQSHVGDEVLYHGEVSDPREYLDIALDGSDGQRMSQPLVAVCAHGKHDQCCAVRGRGVASAIAAEFPELTWECSHLGGDRFAATMLVLPEGLCYGRADSTDPLRLVQLYLEGRLDNSLLRGRTSIPHAAQAAQYFARQAFDNDRIDTFAPLSVESGDGTTEVVLEHGDGFLDVTVRDHMSDPLLSQCSATMAGAVRLFHLESMCERHGPAVPGRD